MSLPRHLGTLALATGLAGFLGCASVDVPPLAPAGIAYVDDQNPVYVPLGKDYYGKVYENVLQVLGDQGFEFLETNRYDGRVETRPRTAPGLILLLRKGSPDLYERLLATTQSYRHRVTVVIHPAEQGGYFIEVTARKELEDLPRPVRSAIGGAIFRTDVDRTYEVVDPDVAEPSWIYKGRDCALEQEIIRRLKKLM